MDSPTPASPTAEWVAMQKKEDIFEEIIYNSKKTNLTHLRRVGWNGFPVSTILVALQAVVVGSSLSDYQPISTLLSHLHLKKILIHTFPDCSIGTVTSSVVATTSTIRTNINVQTEINSPS